MNGRLSQLLPLVFLAALALVTYWLDLTAGSSTDTAKSPRHAPDMIASNVAVFRTGVDGTVKHTLRAARMTHFPDDDNTLLEHPAFTSTIPGRPALSITADKGRVTSRGSDIYLENNVVAVRAADGKRGEMKLITEFLHVLPDDHIARTDRKVYLEDAHTRAEAIGLELNSEARTAEFKSQFKGSYHDPGRQSRR
jgi:lipopolysaccharide export system protein LptC